MPRPEEETSQVLRSAGIRFLVGVGTGIGGVILGLTLMFVILDQSGRLKAPAFANRLSFDEKLRYLRQNPPEPVEVLLLGSSTTLHGIDGAILQEQLGIQGEVLNLSVQDLRVNQIGFLADVFVAQYPGVDQVIMVSTTLDYKDCGSVETRFFKPEDVLGYLNGGFPLYYYFRYLDLKGVLKRAREMRHLRGTITDLESVAFDEHGSLLLNVPREGIVDRVWEGDPITLDPPYYPALRRLAENLRDRGIRFTFVIAPMRPGYLAGRDPDGALIREHLRRLDAALRDTGAIVINAHDALDVPEPAFFDAYHLKRDHARQFTRFVSERLLAELHRPRDRPGASPAAAGRSRALTGT
jgi:hypothetical protein